MILVFAVTLFFGAQFPKVHFDNDPENMLSKDEFVRIFHHQTKEKFGLYDFVIVGIVNEDDPDGIFNVETLTHIDTLTHQLLSLRPGPDGLPQVATDKAQTDWQTLDLSPKSGFQRAMNKVFGHNPNRLFDDDGNSAIIARELISPSVVDNIKQADQGSLKMEYLMEHVPQTREEALVIREDAMNNPLYKGTLVSEDAKAICIYIPITEKTYSYNVATLVKELSKDWNTNDKIYIAGLPVAEDTFGVEMLVQMAISAPMAMLILFLLMYFFFRRVSLILAPLLLAIVTVVWTMGLLIGLGYDVHIMSSMIPIFIMPITVCNSIHVLSEFFDSYRIYHNKTDTLRHVVKELFMPMLFATTTTIAGFASLATTPIPPVRVFGLHVAFGVGVGWLLTMTFVPAFITLFISEKSLQRLPTSSKESNHHESGLLPRFLNWVGDFTYNHAKRVVWITVFILAISVYGISLINVNDNPVKWFTKNHELRVADTVLNDHFGGTYTAYLTLAPEEGATTFDKTAFEEKLQQARIEDQKNIQPWEELADTINYLDDPALQSLETLRAALPNAPAKLFQSLENLSGEALRDAALDFCDTQTQSSAVEKLLAQKTELTAPVFKRPDVLRWIAQLQDHLMQQGKVGKTSSVVDAIRKAYYELNYAEGQDNDRFFTIPDTAAACGQVYMQLEGMKKKDTLFHLVTRDFQEANIWVQLTSGDNQDMSDVVKDIESYVADNPPPIPLKVEWAGLTYLNVVWQDKMVVGMLSSLISSFVVVLIMMLALFRSGLFGVLAMLPLTVTITFIYGLIGWFGKDYDMPVAILSAMTLGLSVDFAIHFLERGREMYKAAGNWKEANARMFQEPAKAISRNAIVIALGFTPLLLAPLVPYRTVGFFLAMIMLVSWLATLFMLPALIRLLEKRLFK
jgi:predicted RND superfamily exporter protein